MRPVWRNGLGGLTFELGVGVDRCFVKWEPAGGGIDLADEAARMSWAVAFTVAPRVLDYGQDASGSWLMTSALPGVMAVVDRWKGEPAMAVRAIGEGLRAMHDALPVADCPFSWAADSRLADARRRAQHGLIESSRWHPVHQQFDVEQALTLADNVPDVDELVACHGDSCAPNTLLHDDGRWSGHVDLGALGTADRWADLAVATWSTQWNYGPGWERPLLDAYGTAPDAERTRYYRLLWDLGP